MNYAKAALWIVERLFDVAEIISNVSDLRQKKKAPDPSQLSLRDLIDMKRDQDDRVRRSSAPTVVIPPPSERDRQRR